MVRWSAGPETGDHNLDSDSRHGENNRYAGALADLFFPDLLFTIQHNLIESLGQGLAA